MLQNKTEIIYLGGGERFAVISRTAHGVCLGLSMESNGDVEARMPTDFACEISRQMKVFSGICYARAASEIEEVRRQIQA
jgi:hypothetical protein